MIGKVLWFDAKKGFGFIRSDSQDIFVHFSKIDSPPGEFRILEEGETVEFELFQADRGGGDKKPQAKDVKRLGGAHGIEIQREHRDRHIRRPDEQPKIGKAPRDI